MLVCPMLCADGWVLDAWMHRTSCFLKAEPRHLTHPHTPGMITLMGMSSPVMAHIFPHHVSRGSVCASCAPPSSKVHEVYTFFF